jgi:hypothetical protein
MAETGNRDAWRIGPASWIAIEMCSRASAGFSLFFPYNFFRFDSHFP